MRATNTDEIKEVLSDMDFPASKEEIVDHARDKAAGTEAERALRALPLGEYGSVAEVQRSVPLEPDPDRTASERNYQRRHHRKPGLAEHEREVERPPVEDELRSDPGERPR
ncbi:DUF2795 domain-containing protein [Actinoallomurus rhizosphaericola]|uniref:DUF2795 domain-containing protein n=1 Tax=Actinoallomurus rhizosphaericola TaxID=2952536 RepID=UPI00209231F3|nr:DUF2795 domain-containing protein [Actinoallomurus rhizosphaericola]MCO5995248.1 DUF2795 domain-containing protein [Actinoallomurus rhizosphaericola]